MSIPWKKFIAALLGFVLSACSSRAVSHADIAPVAELVVIPTYTATVARMPAKTVNTPEPAPVQAVIVPVIETPHPRPTPTKTPPPEPTATPTPVDWLKNVGRTEDNLIYLGNPNAPVTMIDYSDFMWPSCRTYVIGTEPELRETYIKTGRVRLIFNPVLSHGSYSEQSHLASECAAEQGQFWAMHNLLFENQDALWGDTRSVIEALAAQLGLASEQFKTCMDDQRYLDLLYSQDQIRQEQGIWGQPVFDINGDRLFGAQPVEIFQEIIEAKG